MIILSSVTSLTIESAFILTVAADVYGTVSLCNSSRYNEYEGLSRFFCFIGILFYRLCFEIVDYLLVQNVFVILRLCLVTKLFLKLRKVFLYLEAKLVNCLFQTRILISLTHWNIEQHLFSRFIDSVTFT